jgi:hypothetical protein
MSYEAASTGLYDKVRSPKNSNVIEILKVPNIAGEIQG